MGIEVYRDRPIFYGCGDFINDYEGISGYEEFRSDLSLMYFMGFNRVKGSLEHLEMVPMQIKKFRLNQVLPKDAAWLRATLDREGRTLGTQVELTKDNNLTLHWDKVA